MESKKENPLHGVTLEMIVTNLQAKYGWARLGEEIKIRCFTNNPNLKSSLVFLRRTPWARKKVEDLYIFSLDNTLSQNKTDKNKWPDMKL
jgi:uncharacterized protein (DUF2132 family)